MIGSRTRNACGAVSAVVRGVIAEVGEGEYLGKVKVRFPQLDGLVSDWLAVLQTLTLGANTWLTPRKDTQVIVAPGESSGFEDAVVLGATYSKVDKPPFSDVALMGMIADDGVEISYDPKGSVLKIQSPKEINIIATNINIQADIDIQGDIKHSGDLDQTGDAKHSGNLDVGGTAVVTGQSTLTGGAVIAGIDFVAHKHSPGTPYTTPPVP